MNRRVTPRTLQVASGCRHAALSVILTASLLVPKASLAGPCDPATAERSYHEVQDVSLSDEQRVALTMDGLAHSQECPASAELRQGLAVVLLNAASQLAQGIWPEGRSALLCDAVRAAEAYQKQREGSEATRDGDVQARLDALMADSRVAGACRKASEPPGDATIGGKATNSKDYSPRAIARGDVRAGVGMVTVGAGGLIVAGILSVFVYLSEQKRLNWNGGQCVDRNMCPVLAGQGESLEVAQNVTYGISAAVMAAGLITLGVGLARHRKQSTRGTARLSFQGTSIRLRF